METIVKAVVVYAVVWALIRISGRRTLAEMTAFDFVLFTLIGGAVHRALTGRPADQIIAARRAAE